jgi:hypothetical protein
VVYGIGLERATPPRADGRWQSGASLFVEETVQHLDLAGPAGGELGGTVALTLLGLGLSFGN